MGAPKGGGGRLEPFPTCSGDRLLGLSCLFFKKTFYCVCLSGLGILDLVKSPGP